MSIPSPPRDLTVQAIVCRSPSFHGVGSEEDFFTLRVRRKAIPTKMVLWEQITAKTRLQGILLSIKPRRTNAVGIANITITALGLESGFAGTCTFKGSFDNFQGLQIMTQESHMLPFLGSSMSSCLTPVWGRNRSEDVVFSPVTRHVHGLSATYYANSGLSLPSFNGISLEVDFSNAYGSAMLPTTAGMQWTHKAGTSAIGIRWTGFIQPDFAATYTLKLSTSDIDERVKMWVDNALIVDQWSSLSSTQGSATWGFAISNSFYDIRLEVS